MFAADARKHTPGKNAEKENFSMRILVCDDDAAFAGQLAEKIEAIVKPQMPRSTVDCATDAALLLLCRCQSCCQLVISLHGWRRCCGDMKPRILKALN